MSSEPAKEIPAAAEPVAAQPEQTAAAPVDLSNGPCADVYAQLTKCQDEKCENLASLQEVVNNCKKANDL